MDKHQGYQGSERPGKLPLLADQFVRVAGRLVAGPFDANYGVIYDETSRSSHYFAVSDNGYFCLTVLDLNRLVWTPLIDWTPSTFVRPGEVNRLAVMVTGTHYVLYINDWQVAVGNDQSLGLGRSGVAANVQDYEDGVFEFTDFEVDAP